MNKGFPNKIIDSRKEKGDFLSKYETHIEPFFDLIEKWISNGATEKQCAENLRRCIFNVSEI